LKKYFYNLLKKQAKSIIKGAGKAFKLGRKGLGKILTKANVLLHSKSKSPRVRAKCKARQSLICKYLGEPVDAASGHLTGAIQGFELDGPIPFIWKATYYSDSEYQGALGLGIYHSLSHTLMVSENEKMVILSDSDGITTPFPLLKLGDSFFNEMHKWELHRNLEGEYYVSNKNGLFYYFESRDNADGWKQLRLICDRNGYSIRLNYNHEQRLTSALDALGRTINFASDRHGRIISVDAPSANDPSTLQTMVSYTYDDIGRMTSFDDATNAGQVLTWNDDNNKLASRCFKKGHKFVFTYDKQDRCIAAEGPGGMYSYFFEYQDNLTIVTDSEGTKKRYYHRDGIVVKEVDSRDGIRIYHYDDYDNLLSEEAPDATVRIFDYDNRGNTTRIQLPGRGVTEISYNAQDLPITIIQPNGGKWEYEYDESGNLTKKTNPEARETDYEWESGILQKIIDSQSGVTILQYDSMQSLAKVIYPDKSFDSWQRDQHGNTLLYRNAKGAETRYSYDLADRVKEIYLPDENLISYSYDLDGNLTQYKDKDRQIFADYNLFGDIVNRYDAKGSLNFLYDREGRLTGVTNQENYTYQLLRDGEGDISTEIGFDGIRRDYQRDHTGRISSITLNKKYTTAYQYDDFSRLWQVTRWDGEEEQYAYDLSGQLTEAQNKYSHTTLERDIMGRITKETTNGHEILSVYNLSGNRTRVTSSLGADIQSAYNPYGDLEEIQSQGWQTSYKRDSMGLEVERLLPGNIRRRIDRDQLGRIQTQDIYHNQQVIDQQEFQWGTNDRLTAVVHNGKERSYEYDPLGYLIRSQYEDGTVEHRHADKVGNLYESINQSDRKYSEGGKLLNTKQWEYKYDDLGNLIRKKDKQGQVWRYRWNSAGMLTEVKRPDAVLVTFKYDTFGRRIEKRFHNTLTYFVWDGMCLCMSGRRYISLVTMRRRVTLMR